jgi:hypothetical protein
MKESVVWLFIACIASSGACAATDDTEEERAAAAGSISRITVDLRAPAFPALVKKFGLNQQWQDAGSRNRAGLKAARRAGLTVISGLFEPNKVESLRDNPDSVLNRPPPFLRETDGGAVVPKVNPRLLELRDEVGPRQLSLMQLAGVPTEPLTPSASPMFRVQATTASENGNWYPLPVAGQQAEYADAVAAFTRALEVADGRPTIWTFWQEPDHTLGMRTPPPPNQPQTPTDVDRRENRRQYAGFYRLLAARLLDQNPDLMIGCCQENQASGNTADGRPVDGRDYKTMLDFIAAGEAADNTRARMDYFTIQNYKAEASSPGVIANARFALTHQENAQKYDHTALVFNELSMAQTENDPPYWTT